MQLSRKFGQKGGGRAKGVHAASPRDIGVWPEPTPELLDRARRMTRWKSPTSSGRRPAKRRLPPHTGLARRVRPVIVRPLVIGARHRRIERREDTGGIVTIDPHVAIEVRLEHMGLVDRGVRVVLHRVVRHLSLIHISEPTRLLSISYAVFCLKKK